MRILNLFLLSIILVFLIINTGYGSVLDGRKWTPVGESPVAMVYIDVSTKKIGPTFKDNPHVYSTFLKADFIKCHKTGASQAYCSALYAELYDCKNMKTLLVSAFGFRDYNLEGSLMFSFPEKGDKKQVWKESKGTDKKALEIFCKH